MFGLSPDAIVLLTVVAGFSQAAVLTVTLYVFYRNLLVLKRHNDLTIERFTFQSKVEKYDLTLKFADWVKSELQDYIPYVAGDVENEQLSDKEIKLHFDNIANTMIELINKKFVFKSLMHDEIKKLMIVLESIDNDDKYVAKLRLLLEQSSVI